MFTIGKNTKENMFECEYSKDLFDKRDGIKKVNVPETEYIISAIFVDEYNYQVETAKELKVY